MKNLHKKIEETFEEMMSIGEMLFGCIQTKRNKVQRKDESTYVSPPFHQFQYRVIDGQRRCITVPAAKLQETTKLVANGERFKTLMARYIALKTEATLNEGLKKKTPLLKSGICEVDEVLSELGNSRLDANGLPESLAALDTRLMVAVRSYVCRLLEKVYTHYGTPKLRGVHGKRSRQVLTEAGWIEFKENYIPRQESVLRRTLCLKGKTTPGAHAMAVRCGSLGGSFREGQESLLSLCGIGISVSSLRMMTLRFGEKCLKRQESPSSDVRCYYKKPAKGVKPVGHTLVAMLDGAAANCCKEDTKGVKGKNGEAKTRQIRVAVFSEYMWLDKKGRPVPFKDSFSYFISGKSIDEVTSILRKHGVARGSGTAPRMQCLADGEVALERAFEDAFPHAIFTNDFYHACEHANTLVKALGLEVEDAAREYRFIRGILYRLGAESLIRRVENRYQEKLEKSETARSELEYFRKRKDNMRYGQLRKEGYYIGTGHVEAAARVLVIRRCKQAGMRWRHQNAIFMSATHANYRSNRENYVG